MAAYSARLVGMRAAFAVAAVALVIYLAGCTGLDESGPVPDQESEPALVVIPPTVDPELALPTSLCAEPQPSFVTDLEVHAPPALDEPAPRVPFRDPVFGTCVVRATDRRVDASVGGLKNEYARVGAFNADGSAFLIYGTQGAWILYDAASLQPRGQLPLNVEPRWDAQDPNRIYYGEETRLMAFDIASGRATVVHDFASDFPGQRLAAVWSAEEGRPDRETHIWGLVAEDQDWLPVAFVVYDRLADTVTIRDMRGVPGIEEDIDHVTITPLGTTLLAAFDRYCEAGTLGTDARPCGLMAYDRGLHEGRGLLRIVGHYDVALDAAGREVVIYQDIDTDEVSLLDLATGAITPLWAIDFGHTPLGFHFSGLAYAQPGWAVVSTYSGGTPVAYTWMDDQVLAVELRADGRIVRLAHTRSVVDPDQEHDYWAEPHATVNADFTRILFTSNWGRSGTEDVDTYLIALPFDWLNRLP